MHCLFNGLIIKEEREFDHPQTQKIFGAPNENQTQAGPS